MSPGKLGLFVAVEGIDAVGKRTQTSILGSWFSSHSLTSRTLSFPDYGTTIGHEIRKFLDGQKSYPPEVRAMLYAANRWEKKAEIERTIADNDATIVNRYTGSNLAYGVSNGLRVEWLANLEVGLPVPDLVLVLDASPELLVRRRGENKDTYERNLALQTRARGAYLDLSSKLGWKVIDASKGIDDTSRGLISSVREAVASKGRTV